MAYPGEVREEAEGTEGGHDEIGKLQECSFRLKRTTLGA